jgi:hypothetical protein
VARTLKKAKRKTGTKKPIAPGHRTVRAWFDTIINPLLRALEHENSRLLRFNWTWQFRLGVLEHIRPAEQYISHETRDNLDQFLNFQRAAKTDINKHDKEVEALTNACQRLHAALVNKSPLPRLYEELTTLDSLRSAWNESRFRGLPLEDASTDRLLAEFFGGFPKSDHVSVLAEYIVNNIGDLPDHYTTAPFWNRYRERLMQVLQASEVRNEYRQTQTAGAQLRQTSNELRQNLQQIRLELSITYDLPYVDPKSIPPASLWSG